MKKSFSKKEMQAFEPAEKIGIFASISNDNLPHISLITSIMANTTNQLTIGEFSKGLSKEYIKNNPKIGFFIMTLNKKMWRGKAEWFSSKKDGPELEKYNNLPMFRYNAYLNISNVHYFNLIETSKKESLPLIKIFRALVSTKISQLCVKNNNNRILKPFAEKLFNQLSGLKFLSYIDKSGFPTIIPIIQCCAVDSNKLYFSNIAYKEELEKIPVDSTVAVFCMSLKMESVLVRGKFKGLTKKRFMNIGIIDINWAYNSMIPCHGQIYPKTSLKPINQFI